MGPRSAGPRFLLRSLHATMAEQIKPQDRLNKIVQQIAANMGTEVCSIYVLRSDGYLELFATQGLNKDAVHAVSLRIGEGLVGLIASTATPLNLSDARHHSAFAYMPQTGEELYHSFLGVPILRAGCTLGVLVVQNQISRVYQEEEVEALQTIAMVFAEMIVGEELRGLLSNHTEIERLRSICLKGVGFSAGVGLGHVLLHHPRIVVTNLISDTPELELQRLDKAVSSLRLSVDNMLKRRDLLAKGDHRDVLEAYRMFAYDRGWVRKIKEAIDNGLTAEAAVEKVQSDTKARMLRQSDPYLRERLYDLDDLAHRLMRQLMGRSDLVESQDVHDAIIVARTMGAADLLDYQLDKVRGLIMSEGSLTSHVTIIARALGIPTVGCVDDVLTMVDSNDPIIVDGDAAEVHIRPAPDVEKVFANKVRMRARRQARYSKLLRVEPISRDGVHIDLKINAGLSVDLETLKSTNANGIGLFRTELQFMIAPSLPSRAKQQSFYKDVLDKAGDKPVTFRLLDIGGDKIVPYMRLGVEENPAMGWRAIRIGLDRPGLLRVQVRALLQAAKDRALRLLIPMVTEVSELREARTLVEKEIAHASRHGHGLPSKVSIGAMIEVPSLLWQMDDLLEVADFVSVGSNDLLQFLNACDRGNNRLSERYDSLTNANLSALKSIIAASNKADISVTLCGEMGGKPIEALALLGLGYRSLSMNPSSIGSIKAMVLETDIGELSAEMTRLMTGHHTRPLRDSLVDFAHHHAIPLSPDD